MTKIKVNIHKFRKDSKTISSSSVKSITKKSGNFFKIKYRNKIIDVTIRNDGRIEIPKRYRRLFKSKTATLNIIKSKKGVIRRHKLKTRDLKQNKYSTKTSLKDFEIDSIDLLTEVLKKDNQKYKREYFLTRLEWAFKKEMNSLDFTSPYHLKEEGFNFLEEHHEEVILFINKLTTSEGVQDVEIIYFEITTAP